jgi:hypothetical protein
VKNQKDSIKRLTENISLILAKNRNILSTEDRLLLESTISELDHLKLLMISDTHEAVILTVSKIISTSLKYFLSSQLF